MPATPTEVFHTLLTGIVERRFDTLADLYAEDCVVEVPFAVPEPFRFTSKAAMLEHFSRGQNLPFEMTARDVEVHETTDPEVIIGEWKYDFRVKSTGKELTTVNIQVMRVRDGRIAFSRDFHQHAALAELMSQ